MIVKISHEGLLLTKTMELLPHRNKYINYQAINALKTKSSIAVIQ